MVEEVKNMATAIIILVLVVICVFSIKSYVTKLSHGCCGGGGDAEKKVKVADTDEANYPYKKRVGIEGMTCNNCKMRVENTFNQMEGTWANVDLKKKEMLLCTKTPMDEADIRIPIAKLGYTMTEIKEA